MAEVIWDRAAIADLDEIAAYLERDSPIAARRLVQRIVNRVERLKTSPHTGGFIDEDDRHVYRQLIQGNYRLIYRCERDDILIVAVYHAARLLPPSRIP